MSFSFAASPRGERIGFAAVSGPSRQVLLTVAPKVWRAGQSQSVTIEDLPHGHSSIGLFETDRMHIAWPSPESRLLMNSLLRANKTDGREWDSCLLAPEVAPRKFVAASLPPKPDSDATASLLLLFQRVELLLAESVNLRGIERRSPLHRALTIRQFLDDVEHRLSQARRGYRRVVEKRSAIRGRVLAASVGRYVATGDPVLTCAFEELTESTLLLSVICSALEAVADGRGERSVFPDRYSEPRMRNDAVRLRRNLIEVQAQSATEALRLGRGLVLHRLDRPWATALRLALVILEGKAVVPGNSRNRDFDAVELSVETDRVWEWIVTAALKRTAFDVVIPQEKQGSDLVQDPWIKHPLTIGSATHPDNVARLDRRLFVVDAKYKQPQGAPDRTDQYQLYAYSHLVRSNGADVRAAVLVYPGSATTSRWIRGRDTAEIPVNLFAVQIPFPTPKDLNTRRQWDAYLSRIGQRLGEELGLVESASVTRDGY